MHILISGASGLLGTALANDLKGGGHRVSRLVRRSAKAPSEIKWDPAAGRLDPRALDGVDALVNYSGAGLGDRPWTRSYVELLYQSRLDATRTLVKAMHRASNPPAVFLCQSGANFYGDTGGRTVDETAASSSDSLLADLCRRWEAAAAQAPAETRTVHLRTGIVIAPGGGAIGKLLLPLRLGVGGPLGSGQQYWPWISLPDNVAATSFLLEHDISGPVNLVAPEPATVNDLVAALAQALDRPAKLRVPDAILAAALGRMAKEVLLSSIRIEPAVLASAGFTFGHPTIGAAAQWLAGELQHA
jgi:uncharacterized protein (TIGR01777 family)